LFSLTYAGIEGQVSGRLSFAAVAHARGRGGAGKLHRTKQSAPVRGARRGKRGRAQQVVFARDERRVEHFGRVQRVDVAARRSQRRHCVTAANLGNAVCEHHHRWRMGRSTGHT
jgi:hypothetical protein